MAMIYFDMDGVLADFNRGVHDLCDMEPSDLNNPDETHDNNMWEEIRKVGDFYYQLRPIPGAVELFRKLHERFGSQCQILTGVPKPKRNIPNAGDDKKRWVCEYLGDDVIVNVVLTEDKKNYVKDKECILVDDMSKNICAWKKAGGTGVLFLNAAQAEKEIAAFIETAE